MNPMAVFAVKFVSGGATAALITLGLTAGLADASATPNSASASSNTSNSAAKSSNTPNSAPASSNAATASTLAGVQDAVRFAVFEAEADVLRIPADAFRADLERGIAVARLASERGMNKEQFADRLVVNLRPRLAQLVHLRVITDEQSDHVIDRIHNGNIPWWDGLHA